MRRSTPHSPRVKLADLWPLGLLFRARTTPARSGPILWPTAPAVTAAHPATVARSVAATSAAVATAPAVTRAILGAIRGSVRVTVGVRRLSCGRLRGVDARAITLAAAVASGIGRCGRRADEYCRSNHHSRNHCNSTKHGTAPCTENPCRRGLVAHVRPHMTRMKRLASLYPSVEIVDPRGAAHGR